MANDATKVTLGKPLRTGGIYRAPIGTALPTDATTALATAFKGVGFVSSDGVKRGFSSDSSDIQAWGGVTVAQTRSKDTRTVGFTMIESASEEPLKVFFGDANVTVDSGTGKITVLDNASELEHSVYVIETWSNGFKTRDVFPDAQVGERADVSYKDEDVVGYGVTLKAFADSAGQFSYIYKAPVAVAP